MKKIAAMIMVISLLSTCAFTAIAASVDVTSNKANALFYYKTTYAADYAQPSAKKTADVWSLYCISSPENFYDATYDFMIPSVDPIASAANNSPANVAKDIMAQAIVGHVTSSSAITQSLVTNLAARQAADGSFPNKSNDKDLADLIWSIVALEIARNSGMTVNYDKDKAISALIALQKTDGGFNYWDMELDTTGMALIALSCANTPAADTAKSKAVTYLKNSLDSNANMIGKGTWDRANSCAQAYGIIGLIAAGEDIFSSTWTKNDKSIVDVLLSYQATNGGFLYDSTSATPDYLSTYQCIMALTDIANGQNLWVALANPKVVPETVTSTAAAEATALSTAYNNPPTGERPISPIIWIVLVLAGIGLVGALVSPIFKKKTDGSKPVTDTTGAVKEEPVITEDAVSEEAETTDSGESSDENNPI